MGQMKALVMDIEDMLSDGIDVVNTAKYLGAPLELVEEIYENLFGPEYIPDEAEPDYDYDGQPDWAQEWHDFDPDC